ncbi:MAG TPA: 5'-deoxynucleotidase, partial [Ruminococcaceae bacterium]|nr:5'-deoxynucleotidase [Oscillospiraceae bacterium]
MEHCSFYAMLFRMKYINRWGLMRNTRYETLSEHSFEVAVTAHAIATIKNEIFGGHINAERAAVLALYHDAPEILTGDMPTPVKYYNAQTKKAYDEVEQTSISRLLEMLPEQLRGAYESVLVKTVEDAYLWRIVKAADTINALVKCTEEEKSGNREFAGAKKGIEKKVYAIDLPEVKYYLENFLPSFELT